MSSAYEKTAVEHAILSGLESYIEDTIEYSDTILSIHNDIADVKHSNKHATSMNKNTFLTDFTDELVDYFEIHMTSIFKKQIDIDIAYALIELLKQRDDIENFNKKSLYILIKEMTQVNTAKITNVVNVMKKHYKKVFNKFYDVGIVN